MAKILIAWELGSGLGHVGPLRAVGSELARRGHAVTIAAPNTELCRQAFAGTGVEAVAAPVLPLSDKRLKLPCTYSDTLHDCGYSSAEQLTATVGDWLQLFDAFRPDLVLADHSPTALLAAQLRDFPVATIGTGFVCPPDVTPLPSLRPEIPAPHWAAELEQTVLANMNASLEAHGGPALERVAQVFGAADRQYLLTFPALDHYGKWRSDDPRRDPYWPPIGNLPGQRCQWPSGVGAPAAPKVYVYLRDNAALLPILRGLAYKRYPTIAYGPHLSEHDESSFCGSSVSVCRNPVDLNLISGDCNAAVLHGGHGTVCEFLRGGVPMLILPLSLEQRITGDRLTELGLGAVAPLDNVPAIAEALQHVLDDSSYQAAARDIGQQLTPGNEQANVELLAMELMSLLEVSPTSRVADQRA